MDRLYSVIGVANASNGDLVERVRYTPYGVARLFDADQMAAKGDVDGVDWNKALSFYGQSYPTLAEGQLSRQTIANTVGYAGYLFDPATEMYCVRFRWYGPDEGRWMSRDPLKYFDSANLYLTAMSSPTTFTDYLGLTCVAPNSISQMVNDLESLRPEPGTSLSEPCGAAALQAVLAALRKIDAREMERVLDQLLSSVRDESERARKSLSFTFIEWRWWIEKGYQVLGWVHDSPAGSYANEMLKLIKSDRKLLKRLTLAVDAVREAGGVDESLGNGHTDLLRQMALVFGFVEQGNVLPKGVTDFLSYYRSALNSFADALDHLASEAGRLNYCSLMNAQRWDRVARGSWLSPKWAARVLDDDDPAVKRMNEECEGENEFVTTTKRSSPCP